MDKIEQTFMTHWDSFLVKVPDLLEGLLILIIFVFIAYFVRRLVASRLENQTEDILRARFLSRVARYSIIIIGLMLAMKAAGYGGIAAGLLAGAGISAFVVGFALKDIGENFLAGFLLSFSRPFRINDTIEVEGIKGKVQSLNLRNTHVKTADGKDIFIPNASLIKNPLQNYTLDGYLRQDFVIGVDYGTDFSKARGIIMDVMNKNEFIASDHGDTTVSHDSLGSSTYNIQIKYWQDMFNSPISGAALKTSLVDDCLKALEDAGVGMPGEILEIKPQPEMKLMSS